MEEFCTAFDEAIVDHVHAYVHMSSADRNPRFLTITAKEYDCTFCSPKSPCTAAFTTQECIQVWTRDIADIRLSDVQRMKNTLFNIPVVMANIEALKRVMIMVLDFVFGSDSFIRFIAKAVELSAAFPHADVVRCIRKSYYEATWEDDRVLLYFDADSDTYSSILERRIRRWEEIVCAKQTSTLWKEWEMNTSEFTTLIQWLPREMVEEVSLLEGKGYFP
jgi:hypothetical protein